jgi:TP901 family phage tail tape measure protein
MLPKVADMATAAGIELDAAVGMAADAMGVFGLMSDDPLELADNLKYVSDIMVKTASLANMDLPLMYEAVKAGGREFTKANQSIEDFGAAVDVLAANGIKGSEAGNALNSMMIRLSAPAKKGQDALNQLGIVTKDSRGNLLNFTDIIAQFERKMEGLGSAEQARYLDAIFGKAQYSKAAALISTGSEALREYSEELRNAAGATEQMAGVMRNSLRNRIEVLKSSLTEVGFKFIDAFAEKGGEAISRITEAVNNFDVTPLVNAAQSAIDVIQKLVGFIVGAVKVAWQFRGVIIAIAVPLLVYQGALMAITIATAAYAKIMAVVKVLTAVVTGAQMAYAIVIKQSAAAQAALAFTTKETAIATKLWTGAMTAAIAIKKAFTGLTLAQGAALIATKIATIAATAAQWALNVAMTANPIGIIIVAVGALIAAIVLLIKNWEKVTTAIKNNTNKVMTILTVLFGPIGIIISMIKEVASNWAKIKEALAATGLFEKIKEIADSIKAFFQPAIDWLINAFYTVKNAVTGFFSGIANKIRDFFMPAITAVSNFFKSIFGAIYNFVKPALDWLGEKWQQIVSFFRNNAIVNAIKVIAGTLISGILAPIQGLLEILSYIPGLGHLAGKGAEKIQEFRNFLKGVDGATVTAEVNPPDNVTLAPPTGTGTENLTAPDFDMAGFALGGAGGRSRLHGVVDTSGGAAGYSADGSGTYTATSAVGNSSASSASVFPESVTRNVFEITALLRKIDANIYSIFNTLPGLSRPVAFEMARPETATRMSLDLPRVNMNGDDRDTPEYENPRNIAPITQAERTAYNVEERIQRIIIEVAAEQGTAARIIRAPRDAEIELVHSGGNL